MDKTLSELLSALPAHPKIIELEDIFRKAEIKVKEIERLEEKLAIPPINELRYAASHIIKAISEKTSAFDEEIWAAIRHCRRAFFDACDIGISYFIHEFRSIEKKYSEISITDVLPEYVSQRMEVLRAIKDIRSLNLTDNGENRETKYADAEKTLGKIKDLVEKLEYADPELQKKYIQKQTDLYIEKRKGRKTLFWGVTGILATILGTIVAVILSCD